MLVFYKERLAFLAVPKTGSTAYQVALSDRADIVIKNPPDLKHAPVYRYNQFFHAMFRRVCDTEMDVMAVMREPISWLGSWYRYRQRPILDGTPNSTKNMSFDDFISAYCKGKGRPSFANVGSQSKFLEPRPEGASVKYLFRYEDPARINVFLEDRLNIKLDLQQVNVSPQADLTLSKPIEAKLRQRWASEFELYESITY